SHPSHPATPPPPQYRISAPDLETRKLRVSAWHSSALLQPDRPLGELEISLTSAQLDCREARWFRFRAPAEPAASKLQLAHRKYIGELTLSLKYVTAGSVSITDIRQVASRGELRVWIKEARNLASGRLGAVAADPYVKLCLLPVPGQPGGLASKLRTPPVRRSCSPVWNLVLKFENVSVAELHSRRLELTVWDKYRLVPGTKTCLGCVLLQCDHDGALASSAVSSSLSPSPARQSAESRMWRTVLQRHNVWIDGNFLLREPAPSSDSPEPVLSRATKPDESSMDSSRKKDRNTTSSRKMTLLKKIENVHVIALLLADLLALGRLLGELLADGVLAHLANAVLNHKFYILVGEGDQIGAAEDHSSKQRSILDPAIVKNFAAAVAGRLTPRRVGSAGLVRTFQLVCVDHPTGVAVLVIDRTNQVVHRRRSLQHPERAGPGRLRRRRNENPYEVADPESAPLGLPVVVPPLASLCRRHRSPHGVVGAKQLVAVVGGELADCHWRLRWPVDDVNWKRHFPASQQARGITGTGLDFTSLFRAPSTKHRSPIFCARIRLSGDSRSRLLALNLVLPLDSRRNTGPMSGSRSCSSRKVAGADVAALVCTELTLTVSTRPAGSAIGTGASTVGSVWQAAVEKAFDLLPLLGWDVIGDLHLVLPGRCSSRICLAGITRSSGLQVRQGSARQRVEVADDVALLDLDCLISGVDDSNPHSVVNQLGHAAADHHFGRLAAADNAWCLRVRPRCRARWPHRNDPAIAWLQSNRGCRCQLASLGRLPGCPHWQGDAEAMVVELGLSCRLSLAECTMSPLMQEISAPVSIMHGRRFLSMREAAAVDVQRRQLISMVALGLSALDEPLAGDVVSSVAHAAVGFLSVLTEPVPLELTPRRCVVVQPLNEPLKHSLLATVLSTELWVGLERESLEGSQKILEPLVPAPAPTVKLAPKAPASAPTEAGLLVDIPVRTGCGRQRQGEIRLGATEPMVRPYGAQRVLVDVSLQLPQLPRKAWCPAGMSLPSPCSSLTVGRARGALALETDSSVLHRQRFAQDRGHEALDSAASSPPVRILAHWLTKRSTMSTENSNDQEASVDRDLNLKKPANDLADDSCEGEGANGEEGDAAGEDNSRANESDDDEDEGESDAEEDEGEEPGEGYGDGDGESEAAANNSRKRRVEDNEDEEDEEEVGDQDFDEDEAEEAVPEKRSRRALPGDSNSNSRQSVDESSSGLLRSRRSSIAAAAAAAALLPFDLALISLNMRIAPSADCGHHEGQAAENPQHGAEQVLADADAGDVVQQAAGEDATAGGVAVQAEGVDHSAVENRRNCRREAGREGDEAEADVLVAGADGADDDDAHDALHRASQQVQAEEDAVVGDEGRAAAAADSAKAVEGDEAGRRRRGRRRRDGVAAAAFKAGQQRKRLRTLVNSGVALHSSKAPMFPSRPIARQTPVVSASSLLSDSRARFMKMPPPRVPRADEKPSTMPAYRPASPVLPNRNQPSSPPEAASFPDWNADLVVLGQEGQEAHEGQELQRGADQQRQEGEVAGQPAQRVRQAGLDQAGRVQAHHAVQQVDSRRRAVSVLGAWGGGLGCFGWSRQPRLRCVAISCLMILLLLLRRRGAVLAQGSAVGFVEVRSRGKPLLRGQLDLLRLAVIRAGQLPGEAEHGQRAAGGEAGEAHEAEPPGADAGVFGGAAQQALGQHGQLAADDVPGHRRHEAEGHHGGYVPERRAADANQEGAEHQHEVGDSRLAAERLLAVGSDCGRGSRRGGSGVAQQGARLGGRRAARASRHGAKEIVWTAHDENAQRQEQPEAAHCPRPVGLATVEADGQDAQQPKSLEPCSRPDSLLGRLKRFSRVVSMEISFLSLLARGRRRPFVSPERLAWSGGGRDVALRKSVGLSEGIALRHTRADPGANPRPQVLNNRMMAVACARQCGPGAVGAVQAQLTRFYRTRQSPLVMLMEMILYTENRIPSDSNVGIIMAAAWLLPLSMRQGTALQPLPTHRARQRRCLSHLESRLLPPADGASRGLEIRVEFLVARPRRWRRPRSSQIQRRQLIVHSQFPLPQADKQPGRSEGGSLVRQFLEATLVQVKTGCRTRRRSQVPTSGTEN
uniref:C2 domain-containing protein n=1 Tax=Macrostomum lignano TaxID=282301 RepID=A0A1I8I586_9PLAT